MSDLSSSDAKQTNSSEPFIYDPAQGWSALSAIVIVLALIQFAISSRQAPQIQPPQFQVDINQADEAEFLSLPELGPQAARKIVEYRQLHGPFEKLDDLTRVPGIGPATMRTLRPMITVGKSNRVEQVSESTPSSDKDDVRSYAQK